MERRAGFLKIADFGLTTVFDGITQRSIAGTKEYMAPEVDQGTYDLMADIYSLGKIGLELFNIDLDR